MHPEFQVELDDLLKGNPALPKENLRISEWINIKNRLPERQREGFTECIIASYSVIRKIYHVCSVYWHDNYFQDSFGEKISLDDGYWIVTHWMPLPKPPEILDL